MSNEKAELSPHENIQLTDPALMNHASGVICAVLVSMAPAGLARAQDAGDIVEPTMPLLAAR